MKRRILTTLATGTLLLAVGCGGDDMTRFEQNGIAFSHPAGWERMGELEERDRDEGLVVALEGDSGVDGATVRALAFNQPREPGTVGQYGKFVADTRPGQAHGKLVTDGKYDVSGAEGAWRVVVDYRVQPKGGGDPVPARIVDILPVNGDRQYRLTVSGPSEAVNSDQVKKLIDSFEITSDPTA
jgi:hypothetical protein